MAKVLHISQKITELAASYSTTVFQKVNTASTTYRAAFSLMGGAIPARTTIDGWTTTNVGTIDVATWTWVSAKPICSWSEDIVSVDLSTQGVQTTAPGNPATWWMLYYYYNSNKDIRDAVWGSCGLRNSGADLELDQVMFGSGETVGMDRPFEIRLATDFSYGA